MFRIIPVVFLRDLNYADQDFYMWEMKGGDQGRQINIIECQQNQGIVPGVFFFFFFFFFSTFRISFCRYHSHFTEKVNKSHEEII